MKKESLAKHIGKWMQRGGNRDDYTKAFRVKNGRYTYFIRVTKEKDAYGNVDGYFIDVGGKKRGCVMMKVLTYNRDIASTSIAHIKMIRYDQMCSVDGNLESGQGTKHMVKTAMSIINSLDIPVSIKYFTLYDNSRKKCSDGSTVNLANVMIALYGKTYYEKHFFATLVGDVALTYRSKLGKLKEKPTTIFDFNTFASRYRVPQNLEDIYNGSATFHDFFTGIKTAYPDTYCSVMTPWIDTFIENWVFDADTFYVDNKWYIDATNTSRIDAEEWELDSADNPVFDITNVANVAALMAEQNKYTGGLNEHIPLDAKDDDL